RIAHKESAIPNLHSATEAAIGQDQPLTAAALQQLAAHLRGRGDEGKLFSEVDLLNLWYGEHGWEEEQYDELVRLLDDSDDFRRPKARPHRYRLVQPEEKEEAKNEIVFATPQEVLARVESLLPSESGLYHKGYDIASHTLRLMFDFPDVARER